MNSSARRRPGRPSGSSDTKGRILEAARRQFADRGIDGVSVRGVATEADVDPALVLHYFGSKARLFFAAVELPLDPARAIGEALASSDDPGTQLMRQLLATLDQPDARRRLVSIVRSAVSNEHAAAMMREVLVEGVILPAIRSLELDNAELRAALVGSQFAGLLLARYVVAVPPLVDASDDQLIAMYGPALTHYLTAPIPGAKKKRGRRGP